MMGDIFFGLRMFAITLAMVVALQIKVGDETIERISLAWIGSSSVVASLRDVSNGGIKALSQAYRWAAGSVDAKINRAFRSEAEPGVRSLGLTLERSEGYKASQQAKRRAASLEDSGSDEAPSHDEPSEY